MKLRRTLSIVAAAAVVGTGLVIGTAGTASAKPGLEVVGPCGDLLDFVERVAGTLVVTITIPTADSSEVWNLTAQEQEYDAVTGGRIGNPVNLVPNPLPPLAFSPVEGGFTTTMNFTDTAGFTHGFSYTATRTSPTPLTCASQGFWTHPANVAGPTSQNPVGRPDTAPKLTGATEADAGTNDVLLQFDQEMLATAQGIPANNRFSITVNGVARNVTGVQVIDDSPPALAVVDVTFDGLPLTSGQTVGVTYRKQLSASLPQLQDLDNLQTANFGPISVPAF
ncbi:MAG TPA: SwmB domain-containing protein [Pseudonocardiaceae bacterium]|nr:SwmB domain-containing protein [Pseudonocardiaceae bacterium]